MEDCIDDAGEDNLFTLCPLENFSFFFCPLLIFFENYFFEKFFECLTDWIQIRPDILSEYTLYTILCRIYEYK